MLYYLFVDLTDLLSIDGHTYRCFTEAFIACIALYNHLQDFYSDLVDLQLVEDSDSNINTDPKDKQEPLVDFEAFSQQ